MEIIDAAQCRAARALLNWSQPDLAKQCGMHVQTICHFEKGSGTPTKKTLQRITETLQNGGVEFFNDGGVRPRKIFVQQYKGAEGFKAFMDDVYETVKKVGGPIRLYNAKPTNWLKWLGAEWNDMHAQRMAAVTSKENFKITAGHGDKEFLGPYAEYRWLPKKMWNEQSIYTYGDRFATLNFQPDSVTIVVVHNKQTAEGFRALFDVAWKHETLTLD